MAAAMASTTAFWTSGGSLGVRPRRLWVMVRITGAVVGRRDHTGAGPPRGEGSALVGVGLGPVPPRVPPGNPRLAHVVVSKFADHLPLYRQAGILARHGVDIPRSTLG